LLSGLTKTVLETALEAEMTEHLGYLVSESLTNAAKHARASHVLVSLTVRDRMLCLMVRDDGVGGADPRGGSGLVGLGDRLATLGGRIEITSPPGAGTTVCGVLPAVPRSGRVHDV
jgi:signal transduction histidine kinase